MTVTWITGAKGFIGQHLSKYLDRNGYRIFGLGHGAWPTEAAKRSGVSGWINGEISEANLRQLMQLSGCPQVIYHLAGGSSVGLSNQTPAEDFRRSVVSTATLLEWMRGSARGTKLVFSSSAAVYGNSSIQPIPEVGDYTPFSPYGFHKRASELLCESYALNFGLNISIIRLFSVYGPGLRKQLLWDLCNRLVQSPPYLTLHGTGDELRDWLYIDDAVKILAAASLRASPEPFIVNAGTGVATCVRDIASQMCEAWGLNIGIKFSGTSRAGDPTSLIADTNRLSGLGIQLNQDTKSGIKSYQEWFISNP